MNDTPLTTHFSLYEFLRTNHVNLWGENYAHVGPFMGAIRAVAADLEVIREKFGRPIQISRGFNFPELNALNGGVATSQHTKGEAVDFVIHGVDLEEVVRWIVKESGLKYGQVIFEKAGGKTWVHYSLGEPYREAGKCRQALAFDGEKYVQFKA